MERFWRAKPKKEQPQESIPTEGASSGVYERIKTETKWLKIIEEKKDRPEPITEKDGSIMLEGMSLKIMQLFYTDEPGEASHCLQQLEKAWSEKRVISIDDSLTQEQLSSKYEEFISEEEITLLKRDAAIINDMLTQMRTGMPDYQRFKDKPHSKILYVEEVFECPLLNIFAVMGEAQLFKNWVPMMKQSEIVADVSHLRKLAYFRVALPWPFEQRECYLQACGQILKEENAAVLSMCTVDEDSWLGVALKRNPKYVRVDVHRSFIYAQMLDPTHCTLKMVINGDPHITFIPQKLINFTLKNVIGVFIRQIGKKAQKLPQEYVDLIEQKSEYYEAIMRKISQLKPGEELADGEGQDDDEDEFQDAQGEEQYSQ
ncbi:hypothetical protein FGO68_gene8534 [Halteria grandinella]|uniref:START domain-containing protein n=1 Tax=Halteria grandinella TaxID=5974 RepID=A0A8J8NME3_HALGN|nr:hypothetical protein FGO68_gene8534 [Halteria grandinella]